MSTTSLKQQIPMAEVQDPCRNCAHAAPLEGVEVYCQVWNRAMNSRRVSDCINQKERQSNG